MIFITFPLLRTVFCDILWEIYGRLSRRVNALLHTVWEWEKLYQDRIKIKYRRSLQLQTQDKNGRTEQEQGLAGFAVLRWEP